MAINRPVLTSPDFEREGVPNFPKNPAETLGLENRPLPGFVGGFRDIASFVVNLDGQLLNASEDSLDWLGLRTAATWKLRSWYASIPYTARGFAESWGDRDPQTSRVVLCQSQCAGVSGKVYVATFEKLADKSGYLAIVCEYSLAFSPIFDQTKSGLRYEVAFLSVPEQSVVWIRQDTRGVPACDARLDSWESWFERALPEDRSELSNNFRRLIVGSETLVKRKFRIKAADGRNELLNCRFFAVLRDASGKAVLIKAVMQIISGASKASVSLHLGRHLLEHVQESVVATDLSGTIHFWGKGAERLYGWKSDEVLGRNVSLIVAASDRQAENDRLREVMSKGAWRGRYRQIRKDGSSFMASTRIFTVKDDDDKPIGFVGINNDVSEWFDQQRKITEIQASLASAQWITIRGELLAGCCHELCQPVFAIQNFINAISRAIASNAEQDYVQKLLTMCSQEITRASEISAKLREYANHPQLNKTLCQVRKILDDCSPIGNIHAELAGIEFKLEHFANDAQVLCHEIQLRLVLINLIRNSFDALSDCELTVRRVILRSEVRDDTVIISVIDNGDGVPEHLSDIIFKPFFTTKKCGTGIGLPMCRSIIESHQGTLVLAKSEQNVGATFEATLPLFTTQDSTPLGSPTEIGGAAAEEVYSVG